MSIICVSSDDEKKERVLSPDERNKILKLLNNILRNVDFSDQLDP